MTLFGQWMTISWRGVIACHLQATKNSLSRRSKQNRARDSTRISFAEDQPTCLANFLVPLNYHKLAPGEELSPRENKILSVEPRIRLSPDFRFDFLRSFNDPRNFYSRKPFSRVTKISEVRGGKETVASHISLHRKIILKFNTSNYLNYIELILFVRYKTSWIYLLLSENMSLNLSNY